MQGVTATNHSKPDPPSDFSMEERDFTEIIHEYDNRHMLNYPVKRDSGHTHAVLFNLEQFGHRNHLERTENFANLQATAGESAILHLNY